MQTKVISAATYMSCIVFCNAGILNVQYFATFQQMEVVRSYVTQSQYLKNRQSFYSQKRKLLLEEQATYRAQLNDLLRAKQSRAIPVLVHAQLMVVRLKSSHSSRALTPAKIVQALESLHENDCDGEATEAINSAIQHSLRDLLTVKSEIATVEDYLVNDRTEAEARARQLGENEVRLVLDFLRVTEQLKSLQEAKRSELAAPIAAHRSEQERVIEHLRSACPDKMVQPIVQQHSGEARQYFVRYKQAKRSKAISLKKMHDSELIPNVVRKICPGEQSAAEALQRLQSADGAQQFRQHVNEAFAQLQRLDATVTDVVKLDRGHLLSREELHTQKHFII
jgi:hypothetical protein